MCGRKTLTKSKLDIIRELSLDEWDDLDDWKPSFNVAPTQTHPVILNNADKRIVIPGQWGLIPSWAKEKSIGINMINARIETVTEKPSFRNLVHKQRCLIPADGYYEWKSETFGKQPYYIHLPDHALFTFAGLWNIWKNKEENPLMTYTIITTQAANHLHEIHPRMPVMIPEIMHSDWLNPNIVFADMSQGMNDLTPELEYFPVSHIVNNVRENHPACIEKSTILEQGDLFS